MCRFHILSSFQAPSNLPSVEHGKQKIDKGHFSVSYKRGRIPISAEIMEFILMDETDITTSTFLRVFHKILHSAAKSAAQIVMKVFQFSTLLIK